MRLSLPALVFAVIALPMAGCILDKEPARASIVPLAVGNTWTYVDSTYYGNDSIVVAPGGSQMITGTRRAELAGGIQTVYLLKAFHGLTGQPGALTNWLQDRDDGNYTVGAEQAGVSYVHESLHLKYPATAGERYPTFFPGFREEGGTLVPALDTLETEVVNTGLTCTVPAGTFPCVQYRGWRPGNVLHATGYYAPGVGFLGYEQTRILEVNGTPREVVIARRLASFTLH